MGDAPTVFILFVFLVVFVGMAIFVITSVIGHNRMFDAVAASLFRSLQGPIRKLAKRKGGSYISTTAGPRAYFKSGDNNFVVTSRAAHGKQVLVVSTMWQRPKFRMRIFQDKWTPGIKKFIGMEDLEIGSEAFDKSYVLQSNQLDELMAVLSPTVQQLIRQSGSDINLSINGSQLEMQRVQIRFQDHEVFQAVDKFIQLHQEMYDAIFAVPSMEMKVVETETATCMVCGEEITGQRVDCRSCRTAHHQDCWEYLEVCSTYACGSVKYESVSNPLSDNDPGRYRITD